MSRLPANVSRFTLEIVGLAEELSVLSFTGQAEISSLYDYEIEFLCESADLDLDQLLGKSALLTLLHPQHPRVIHGLVCISEQMDVGKAFSRYRINVAPKLWWLQHRSGHRIFQSKSVPDIAKQVLKEAGIQGKDIALDLKSSYAPRDYCVQYGETELAFIQRLLADEGIAFYFRHDINGHTLVLTDHNGTYESIEGAADIRFCQEDRATKDESIIYALHPHRKITVNAANVSDYNFTKPNLRLHSDYAKKTKEKIGQLEDYRYRSQYSLTKGDAARYQKLNQLQATCFQETVSSVSDDVRLSVGYRFGVKEHPNKSLNREYLAFKYQIKGTQPQSKEAFADTSACRYECRSVSVPKKVVFKTKSSFSKPKINGVQTAFVTGPGSNEIYTDSHGRIKVQFHWDREGQYNENTTCWIRVSQALAGKEWGSWSLPRVGQEVIVTFEEGDPDRPLVTGAVYNGVSKPPYPLPKYKSRTGIKTRSTEKGNGFNEIRIEDQKDKEQIYLRAEKNADLRIKNDRKTFVGRDQHTTVSSNAFVDIGKEKHESVAKNQQLDVGQNLSFSVGKDFHLKVSGADVRQVGNQLHIKGGMKTTLQAGTQLSLVAGGSFITLDASGVSIFGPIVRINEGGSASSAKGASPSSPEAPLLPDDDNAGKLEKLPPKESPYEVSKLTFAQGKAQKITLKTAARTRAPLVDYCPDCELQPLPIADEKKGENQVDVLNWVRVDSPGERQEVFGAFTSNDSVPLIYSKDPRFNSLASDPAHANKISVGSRREAMAGLEAESLGVLKPEIRRGPAEIEFYDATGKPVDVKTPPSAKSGQRDFFKAAKTGKSLLRQVDKQFPNAESGELEFVTVLLDSTYMNKENHKALWEYLNKNATNEQLSRIIELNVKV